MPFSLLTAVVLLIDLCAFCIVAFSAAAAQAQADERRSQAGNSPTPTAPANTTKSQTRPGNNSLCVTNCLFLCF